MARIPEEELRRLKREVDLVRLVRRRGVILKPHGEDLIGLCPFHDDTEPSLVVSPRKNLWHCLGACGEGGSVVDWVMKSEGVSFRHAVELLRVGYEPAPLGSEPPPKVSTVLKLPSPVDLDAGDVELLAQVVGYYHEVLRGTPAALAYLESRGLRHEELIDRFRLGFADRTLGLRLPAKTRKAGSEIRGRLERLGVFRQSGHEHFAGCLVIPVLDAGGQVVELYGRKISTKLRKGTPVHLYLPGKHRGVFNSEGLQGSEEVILCESLIDALTFWRAGFGNVTAAYGVNGFTEEHRAALREHDVRRVLLAYDRDDAGDKAAAALAERLAKDALGVFRVQFPRGMDANAYALSTQPRAKALGLVLSSAVWMAGPTERGGARPAVTAAEAVERAAAGGGDRPSTAAVPPPTPAAKEDDAQAASPPLAAGREEGERAPAPDPPPARRPAPEPPAEQPAAGGSTPAREAPSSEELDALAGGGAWERRFGDRSYRVRGLAQNLSYQKLQVLVRVARRDAFFVDSVDLVSAKKRSAYLRQAATELGVKEEVVKADLAKLHFALEGLQDALIRRELEPAAGRAPELSPAEEREALALLRDPALLERILSDFERSGLVGEATNKLTAYLSAVSRKLEKPLAVLVQSSTAAGKSALMEAVLALVPEEDQVRYSAMTGQSLFYLGETDLQHKVLAIAEEEGAERASYALKLLQSEGELTIASTGKDPASGRLVTHEYRVEGPVMLFLTTTSAEVDEELRNRCLVLSVDEDREQTRAIHERQREAETLEGLLAARDRSEVLRVHRNAQRLLRPLLVANPYARDLTFLDDRTRTRRDHVKYLTLIRSIALLHQYQRPRRHIEHRGREVEYIEVTLSDVAVANRLAGEVLGRTLDELPPQTRRLLELLHERISALSEEQEIPRSELRFTRRQVVEWSGWSLTQVRHHLARLIEHEHVLVHRGDRGQSFVYELLYAGEGRGGEPFLPGLLDVEALRHRYDSEVAGVSGEVAGSGAQVAGSKRGHGAPVAAGWPAAPNGVTPSSERTSAGRAKKPARDRTSGDDNASASYRQAARGGS
jgi:DNA primase catalytic core